ncbi:Chromatin assembly factor 1, subunit A, partial [Coemansia sp. RSA 2711]
MAAGKESTTGPVSDGQSQNISAIASPRKKQHVLRGQKSLQNFFTTEKHAPQPLQLGEPKDYYRTTFLPFNVRTDTKLYQHRVPAEFDPKLVDHAVHCPSVGSTADGNIPDKTQLLRELCKLPSPPSSSAAVRARVAPVASGGVDDDDGELHLMQLRQMPMKLIQFHGSRRPAYFGTWSKRLQRVGSRRPFVQDTAELDYEVDSDAEWEAEDEEGEDLRSDDDDDEDDDDEDDEDFDEESGFVVGDGVALSHERASMDLDGDLDTDGSDFCSDDEEIDEINPNEEVCADDMDVDDVAVVIETPAAKPAPMAKKAKSTEKHKHRPQRRRKVVPLTPVIIGLVMDGGDCLENISGDGDAGDAAAKLKALGRLAVATIGTATAMPLYVSVDPADMWEPKNGADGSAGAAEGEAAEGAGTRKGKVITDEDLCVLTNVVHGSSLGMLRLVEELKRLIPGATKAQIERLIHEHAKKEKRPPTTRSQWYVNAELVDRLRSMKLLATPTSDSADSVRAPERSVADFFGAVTNSSASTPA